MRILALAAVLFLAGCATSAVQTMATVCGVYSNTLVSLSLYKDGMSTGQVDAVDQAVMVLSPMCEGDEPDGDAGALALSSLDSLEAILLKISEAN